MNRREPHECYCSCRGRPGYYESTAESAFIGDDMPPTDETFSIDEFTGRTL